MKSRRQAANDIELVELEKLIPADYNPRLAVGERLDEVTNSLKYLGFLLPLYARDDNTLLSGHQRTKAALAAGYTHVPVVRFNPPESTEMGYNLMFNKATNDYTGHNGEQAFKEFVEKNEDYTAGLEPLPPDSFPCLEKKAVPINDVYPNVKLSDEGTRKQAAPMVASSIFMPAVVTPDMQIINGHSRIYAMKAGGYETVDVVIVEPEKAQYAHLCLNLLAMDFDLRTVFYDRLRFNAFRRRSVSLQMVNLSRAYTYWAFDGKWVPTTGRGVLTGEEGKKKAKLLAESLPSNPEVKKRYKEKFGQVIVDLGAGTMHDANLLRKQGFKVLAWEPYCLAEKGTTEKSETVDSERSRQLTHTFLDDLEEVTQMKGKFPDSVVSSFTLNSIPHHEDRIAYLTMAHALCGIRSNFYLATQSVANLGRSSKYINPNIEPNMVLGMGLSNFKVQKFFYPEEVEKLLKIFWTKVEVKHKNNNILAHAKFPKSRNANLLKEALETEFNLPFEDGSTLNAVDRAKKVFSKFTALDLA